MSDKEKCDSYARQIKEFQEKMKGVLADKDIIESEKKLLEEKIKKCSDRITDLEDQIKGK